ncbi:NifU family protein [Rhizobium leguminosarum]|uniref:NifU family protein n=1 Tax=Rhizobium leguminosarum TaxID=384 RepID=UPI002E0E751B|nr:NifU family protein [Rhizobium leguminosarum]
MHVTVEHTPNPNTRMFMPGARVSTVARKWERSDGGDTDLVKALFAIGPVTSLLANEDALSVSVANEDDWDDAQPAVVSAIVEHVATFVKHAFDDAPEHEGDFDQADGAVVEKIKGLIYTHIRPAVARDGGDIVFKSFRDGVLSLDMRGACSGCPSSTATLKNGIQNLMTYFVPEVSEVVAA